MNEQKNTILAIVLSAIVLIGWEYFYALPQKQRQEELQRHAPITQVQPTPQATPGQGAPEQAPPGSASGIPGAAPKIPSPPDAGEQKSREAIITSTVRIPIDTPRLKGSIALKGGRIDDVSLAQYHETVDPSSPAIVLLSPSGSRIRFMRSSVGTLLPERPRKSPGRIRCGVRWVADRSVPAGRSR